MADAEAQSFQAAQIPKRTEQEHVPADAVGVQQPEAVDPSETQPPAGLLSPTQPAGAAGKLSRGSSKKQSSSTLPSKPSSIRTSASGKGQPAADKGRSQPMLQSGQPISADSKPKQASANGSSAGALDKIRAARADAAAAAASSSSPDAVASTISKAKEALAKARSNALNGGHSTTKLPEGVGVVSDKPFMLYGRPEPPKPKASVQISAPSSEESARRKAWLAEKEAMKQRRLAQEEARKESEAAAKDAAAAAKHEAHRKLMEERKAKYEVLKAREREMVVKSEAAWKQYQEQRGRPPMFQLMEDDFKTRQAAEEEAKRAQYEAEVAAGKMATVSQLVKSTGLQGEVVVKPHPGAVSPGRSISPGGALHNSFGSGEYGHMAGHISPNASTTNMHAARGRAAGHQPAAAGKSSKWPGGHNAAAAVAKQVVDRACSPLIPDGSIPPGAKVISTGLGRAQETAAASHHSKQSSRSSHINTMQQLPGEQHDMQEDESVHGANIKQQQQDWGEEVAAAGGDTEEAHADVSAAGADEDQQLQEDDAELTDGQNAEAEDQHVVVEAEEVDADNAQPQQGEEHIEEGQQGQKQDGAAPAEVGAADSSEHQLDEQADGQEQDYGAAAEVEETGASATAEHTAGTEQH